MNILEKNIDPTSIKYMFLDLNSYFASCEQQEYPDLRGRPIIVAPSDSDYTCAIAASYEAKAFGIKTRTKVHEAKRLCPNVAIVPARHEIYKNYHDKIIAEVVKYTPIRKIWSIDEFDSRVTARHQSREGATELAKRIKAGLRENVGAHIKASIGFAPNSFLGKVATNLQKPDGLVIIEGKDLPEILYPLKLDDLCGIGMNMHKRLYRAGIYTIEDLWNASPKQARKIWHNVGGEKFWYRLHGFDVPETETQRSCIGHSRVLDPHLRDHDNAFQIMRRLTTKAIQRMRRENYMARAIHMSAKGVNGERWVQTLSIPASQDVRVLLHHCEQIWKKDVRVRMISRFKHVSVLFSNLVPAAHTTLDLFEDMERQHVKNKLDQSEALNKALEHINYKFGAQTVNFGLVPSLKGAPIGTKIAFSRVPDNYEFQE